MGHVRDECNKLDANYPVLLAATDFNQRDTLETFFSDRFKDPLRSTQVCLIVMYSSQNEVLSSLLRNMVLMVL